MPGHESSPIENLHDPAKQPELVDADQLAELTARLSSASSGKRRRAARALGTFGRQALPALPALIAAFCDRDLSVRGEAVAAVTRLGGVAVPALVEALGGKDPDLCRVVVVTLGEIGPEAAGAIEPLTKALTDEWLARSAATALEKISGRARPRTGPLFDRVLPWLLAGWLTLVAGGLVGTALTLGEMGLFGASTGAAGSASALGGVGMALGAVVGWSRGGARWVLGMSLLLGLGGLLGGLLLGGLLGGMVGPVSRALGGS